MFVLTIQAIPATSHITTYKGDSMFEFEQEIVDALLSEDENFKRLYTRHGKLKKKVNDANNGVEPLDAYILDNLKKEKLQVKDQMALIINRYRQEHPC